METESFFSGYCRNLDSSRMVTVITEQGKLTECDCDYGTCPYAPGCTIAQKMEELIK